MTNYVNMTGVDGLARFIDSLQRWEECLRDMDRHAIREFEIWLCAQVEFSPNARLAQLTADLFNEVLISFADEDHELDAILFSISKENQGSDDGQ